MQRRGRFVGIILAVLGIGLIAIFAYLFFFAPGGGDTDPTIDGFEGLPFGDNVTDFGDGDDIGLDVGDGGDIDDTPFDDTPTRQRLFRVTDEPVSGYGIFPLEKEALQSVTRTIEVTDEETGEVITEDVTEDIITTVQIPRVRYNHQETGVVFEKEFFADFDEIQLVDIAIPDTAEAYFSADDYVFYRYFNLGQSAIQTYAGNLISLTEAATCSFALDEKLEVGATGRTVEQVQTLLDTLFVFEEPLVPGVFDENMANAIKVFQESKNLKPDGVLGPQTRQHLIDLCTVNAKREQEERIRRDGARPYQLEGQFLNADIMQFALSPDRMRIFSLFPVNDVGIGVISNSDGSDQRQVYNLPFMDWIVEWPSENVLSLTTKASGLVPGYMYTIDIENDFLQKYIDGQFGLTTKLSPDGTKALYGRVVTNGRYEFGAYDLITRTFERLSLNTFPEKCVWSEDNETVYCGVPEVFSQGLYPDEWYQRLVQFDDALWSVNIRTGETNLIDVLNEMGGGADLLNLQLAPDEDYVLFVNQTNGELWARSLEE